MPGGDLFLLIYVYVCPYHDTFDDAQAFYLLSFVAAGNAVLYETGKFIWPTCQTCTVVCLQSMIYTLTP